MQRLLPKVNKQLTIVPSNSSKENIDHWRPSSRVRNIAETSSMDAFKYPSLYKRGSLMDVDDNNDEYSPIASYNSRSFGMESSSHDIEIVSESSSRDTSSGVLSWDTSNGHLSRSFSYSTGIFDLVKMPQLNCKSCFQAQEKNWMKIINQSSSESFDSF